jgi:hypothetical protein
MPPCAADLDGSLVVNTADLSIVLGSWGPCDRAGCPADLDENGVVDTADVSLLLGAWGPIEPPTWEGPLPPDQEALDLAHALLGRSTALLPPFPLYARLERDIDLVRGQNADTQFAFVAPPLAWVPRDLFVAVPKGTIPAGFACLDAVYQPDTAFILNSSFGIDWWFLHFATSYNMPVLAETWRSVPGILDAAFEPGCVDCIVGADNIAWIWTPVPLDAPLVEGTGRWRWTLRQLAFQPTETGFCTCFREWSYEIDDAGTVVFLGTAEGGDAPPRACPDFVCPW